MPTAPIPKELQWLKNQLRIDKPMDTGQPSATKPQSQTLRWFDAGVNLFSRQFEADRPQLVMQAQQAGVVEQLLISSDLAETVLNIEFASHWPGLYCSAGVHPHQAAAVSPDWLQQLQQLLNQPAVVAVGECGLDFDRMFSPQQQQIDVFSAQLTLARHLHKAVYLHERAAFDTQLQLLKEHQISDGIAHCFTGNREQMQHYLDLGLYIGITGWLCDERRGGELQDALRYLPLDRLILETDAPYLLPRTLTIKPKPRRNEPAFLPAIAHAVAAIGSYSLADVAWHSRQNCQLLFGLEPIC